MEENKEEIQTKPKKSFLKRLFKVLLCIVLAIIGLNVLLYILLSIPFIQQKVADFAIGELKSKLKTEVSIDEVRLTLFNHATLKGIYIEDQSKDTLLYAKYLDVRLSPLELIKNSKLAITGISLDDFIINVNQKDSVSDFNFQFIIDAFASSDTTAVDTTKSSLMIVIEDIDIKRGRLNYDVLSQPQTQGIFNASHISLHDFEANLDINSLDPDRFDIELNNLIAKEKSGLEITSLQGHFYSNKSLLWLEGLSLSLPNSHLVTSKANYNLESNQFEISTEDTELDSKDLVAFMPDLRHLTNKLNLKTNITGTLPTININDLNVTYGEDCKLEAKANISDYEHYGDADINLSIDKFKISPDAVTSFVRLGDSTFIAPDILKTVGDIFLKGKISGKLSKFKIDAETWCQQGAITLLVNGGADSTFSTFNVNGRLETQNFNLSELVGANTGIGKLTARLSVNAKQTNNNNLTAEAKGVIDALGYKENVIKNIPLEAYYNPEKMGIKTNAELSIGSVFIEADMTQATVPDINFDLDIKNLQIDYFYKNEAWVNPRLNLCLNGHIKGLDIDNMTGNVKIDSLNFRDSIFTFKPGPFVLDLKEQPNGGKSITLNSSLLSANVEGDLKLMTLSDELGNMMHKYIPNIFQDKKRLKKEYNNFTFNITANNTEQLGRIFELPVDIITPASISGRINTIGQQIDINGNIPHIKYGDIDIENTKIDVANLDSAFNLTLGSNVLMGKGLYNLSFRANGASNSVHTFFDVKSDSTDVNIKGHIEALAQFDRDEKNKLITLFQVIPTNISVGKLNLYLMPAKIVNTENKTSVDNFGIMLNNKRYFGAQGNISKEKTDSLKVYFDHAQIGDILEAFDVKNIHADIHGDIMLTNILEQPELYTKGFKVSDIIIFSDTLGTVNLASQWNNELGGVKIDADLTKRNQTNAEIEGLVYTTKDSLDLKVKLDRLPLEWMQPFVADMLNKLSGTISSDLSITGSTKAPQVKGFFGFNNTNVGIDYTNVTYSISDTIQITPDKIGFNNLVLKDSKGNAARVNATVTHKNFENMKYSLDMNLNNLMVLNTENRTDSLFYGRVFASGNMRISGDNDNININMQVRNEKNSNLNIMIPATSEATDYQSVVYINVPEEKLNNEKKNTTTTAAKPLPIKLNIRLTVTPDLALGVIIDPTTGNSMQVKGNGNINFSYDMVTENMTAYGDYTVTDGNVRVNLQNISKLDFRIRDGSRLAFIGDPMKTTFNINAYRRVRADLQTLDASLATDASSSTKVPVDCDLGISGNMDKMNLSYDISLPDATDDIQRRVNSFISTDEQKIRQFAYLVISGSFYSSSGSSGINFNDGMWTSMASGKISEALNAAFGNILGDKWEIGTNIETNDGSFSDMDMSVNVSRKFLDDKLKVNTNLGYRTEASTTDNSFIGDFDVEYQLNSIWTLKAYNHTNDKFYRQAPTTQGIGIVYTKEAATLKRLFQSFKPRRRNRNNNSAQQANTQSQQPVNSTDSVKPVEKQPAIIEEKK